MVEHVLNPSIADEAMSGEGDRLAVREVLADLGFIRKSIVRGFGTTHEVSKTVMQRVLRLMTSEDEKVAVSAVRTYVAMANHDQKDEHLFLQLVAQFKRTHPEMVVNIQNNVAGTVNEINLPENAASSPDTIEAYNAFMLAVANEEPDEPERIPPPARRDDE